MAQKRSRGDARQHWVWTVRTRRGDPSVAKSRGVGWSFERAGCAWETDLPNAVLSRAGQAAGLPADALPCVGSSTLLGRLVAGRKRDGDASGGSVCVARGPRQLRKSTSHAPVRRTDPTGGEDVMDPRLCNGTPCVRRLVVSVHRSTSLASAAAWANLLPEATTIQTVSLQRRGFTEPREEALRATWNNWMADLSDGARRGSVEVNYAQRT